EKNLDFVPMINYDLFDTLYFSKENIERTKFPVFASRGCPNKCTYCNSYGVFGTRFRTRSVENILEELELIHKKYGVKKINFVDDYFVLNNRRAIEICKGMIERDIKLSWGCYSKAGAISPELFDMMKKSGCDHIAYGVENVYPKTLKLINKKTPLDKINATYEDTNPTGIDYKTNIMAGFPWETVQSVRANIDFILEKKRKYEANFNPVVLYPVPKTKLYEDWVDKFPIIKDHWLNKEFMIDNTDLSGEGRMKLNFFNLDEKVIKEIRLLFFCCRIPSVNRLTGINYIVLYPFNKFFYSYQGAKLLRTIYYSFKKITALLQKQ
ncbi:MAG: radical SAM protein, partial [Proteobacteria bacterium]|nr:radical SAM protein [Pseudomonadota bacterium]